MSNTFFWSFENNSTTLDNGGVDFSAGDVTATVVGTATIQSTDAFKGSFAGGYDIGQDYHGFDSASIFDHTTEGSFGLMFNITSASIASNPFFRIMDNAAASNQIAFETSEDWTTGNGGILMRARRDGGSNVVSDSGDVGLALNTWYGLVGRINAVTEEMEFEILTSTAAGIYTSPVVVDITDTIGGWALTGSLEFRFGNYGGLNPWGMYIDNVVFGSAYSDVVEDWIFQDQYDASVTLDADAGSITLTGGDATLSQTGGISEVPSTWFNGQWWNVPTWGTTWWATAGNVTLNAELGTITLTGGDATLTDSTGDITLDVDLGTVTLTGGDASLTTLVNVITADAGVVTLTGGDATLEVEFTGTEFTLSTSTTFDGKGIRFDTDIAFNVTSGITSGVGYKILSRIDIDTVELNGIFGTPPQNYQIMKQISETSVPARIEIEFNGTEWVLISNTPSGL